jgi:multidrug efflux pump subunit AcrB
VSLIAVFLPILLMSGIVGRLMREFAVTVSVAIIMSGIVSLTITPMLCAWLLKPHADHEEGRFAQACERVFEGLHNGYRRSLDWVLDHQRITMAVAIATMVATAALYVGIPKGFFPQQDNGLIQGVAEAAADISPIAMRAQVNRAADIIGQDPAVARVYFWIGPNPTVSQGKVMINLKPFSERTASAGTRPVIRNQSVHAGQPGHPDWWSGQQDPIPVHPARPGQCRTGSLERCAAGETQEFAAVAARNVGPATGHRPIDPGDRPFHGCTAGRNGAGHRRRAV